MPDNTTKDKPPHYGLHPPYAAVCLFRRQAGRPDNGNHLQTVRKLQKTWSQGLGYGIIKSTKP
ncbi:hypothetical protein, partial [Parablautia intestinalis]|uniref:hypothetical protein n=1 Tax=Parablautia intestinalis TaxID=2320100 RepID=UPI0024125576